MAPVVIEGKAGVPIMLNLRRGPATGHEWLLSLPDGVQQIEDRAPAAMAHQLGDAAGGGVQVQARRPGRYRINARLARPWEPDQPVKTVEIDLLVR